jgi:deoxyribonuclease V
MRILLTDVAYTDPTALAAGLIIDHWAAAQPTSRHTATIPQVAPYTPGSFFERELPCLLALLDGLDAPPTCIVVDGHAWLATGRPGLGAHLHVALDARIPVVGVAKNRFAANDLAEEVFRGDSTRPLYVTACGLPHAEAAAFVRQMHGPYRVPTILQMVDALSRGR